MSDPMEMLTPDERFLAQQLRQGVRRPHSLWRYAFTICDVSGAPDQVEQIRFAAERLLRICELAQGATK